MCGIAGSLRFSTEGDYNRPDVREMLSLLVHRGPEMAGIYEDALVSLAHARLSIVDLNGGLQPLCNESGEIWAICNGEFYNYLELRDELIQRGHRFRTQSDTEVLIHLYEELECSAVEALNGEFAFAIWDAKRRKLSLGRDRMGVHPLFYSLHQGYLLFASEIKAILAGGVTACIDSCTLAQVFTTWSPLAGQTMFHGIFEVPPAHILQMSASDSAPRLTAYWALDFSDSSPRLEDGQFSDCVEQVREALVAAVRIRMRADVPVGTYLSGGLDSSAITSIARLHTREPLHTFSIAFADPEFDEGEFQQRAAQFLGTRHHVLRCDAEQIRACLPDVIWHTEVPILRLSPVPMYLLSEFVSQQRIKVVLTGEGADELFAGYDIFKEAMIRHFWARVPDSKYRYLLLSRIYGYISDLQKLPPAALRPFYAQGLTDTANPCYSHLLRWQNTYRASRFFSRALRNELGSYSVVQAIESRLPAEISSWDELARAQYLEIVSFLSTYLLSSQGDRVMMAHAVEGRYPFLDPTVIRVAAKLPRPAKLNGVKNEKLVLKAAVKNLVPPEILARPKLPYRAPIRSCFCGRALPEYAEQLLSVDSLEANGYFDSQAVQLLLSKVRSSSKLSEADQMAFIGILTFQLFDRCFVRDWKHQRSNHTQAIDLIDVRYCSGSHL